MRWLVPLLVVFVFPAFPAQKWIRVTTPHFELYTTAGERTARRGLLHFERVRSFFAKAMETKESDPSPVVVIAFRSPKEFKPYQPSSYTAAFYRQSNQGDYIVMQSLDGTSDETAVHEYTHLLIGRAGLKLPRWYGEGIAEFYSTLRGAGKKTTIGEPILGHVLRLSRGGWMPLETLITRDHSSGHGDQSDQVRLFYAQSWLLVHMLTVSDEYRAGYGDFVDMMAAGNDTASCLAKVYGKSVAKVERDLHEYARARRQVLAFEIKLSKAALTPEIQPDDPASRGLILADILGANGNPEGARAMLEEVVEAHGDDPRIAEVRGYQAWRSGDKASAVQFFSRADELGSTNPKMYRDYAALLRVEGHDVETLLPLLEKCVQLNPTDAESRYFLASVYLKMQDHRRALDHFGRIKKVDPKLAYYLFQGMAICFHELGDNEQALAAARRALSYAPDEATSKWVTQFVEYVERPEPVAVPVVTAQTQEPSRRVERTTTERSNEGRAIDERPPRLKRRGTPSREVERPQFAVLDGTLEEVDCSGTVARLKIGAGGDTALLAVRDPTQVTMVGVDGGTAEFRCGAQESPPVSVRYVPSPDAALVSCH